MIFAGRDAAGPGGGSGTPGRLLPAVAVRAAFVSLLAAAPAFAQDDPIEISVTNKLEYRRLSETSRREEAFRDRLEASAYRGRFSAWIRLEELSLSDVSAYDPFGEGDGGAGRLDRSAVTRGSFTMEEERGSVTVGHFSHIAGRGLSLAFFEDEELNFDSRLEGVRAEIRDDRGTLAALAGSADGDRYRAIIAEAAPWGPLSVGFTGAEAWGSGALTQVADREQLGGGHGELSLGPASLYGEWVTRRFADGSEDGRGGYAQATVVAGGLVLAGELRDYERFDYPYHDPPTTLRQHTATLLNRTGGLVQTDITDDDVRGWLVEADRSLGYYTNLLAGYARAGTHDLRSDYWEGYAEARAAWGERVTAIAGGAESELTLGGRWTERITGHGDLTVEIGERSSIALGLEWEEAQEIDLPNQPLLRPREWRDRIASVSYSRAPWLTVTASYEETTDALSADDDWLFALCEMSLSESHDMVVSYGSERGGWKCSGGVCWYEPEFEGLRLKVVSRF